MKEGPESTFKILLVKDPEQDSLESTDNFKFAQDPQRLKSFQICPYGSTEDGAVVMEDAKQREALAVLPVGPDLFVRVYSSRMPYETRPYSAISWGTGRKLPLTSASSTTSGSSRG